MELSKTQWYLLRFAYTKGLHGIKEKIPVTNTKQITLDILHNKKMIHQQWDIRDPEERVKLEEEKTYTIANAVHIINEDWFAAYKFLEYAQQCETKLNRLAWWLTPEAIELCEQEEQK